MYAEVIKACKPTDLLLDIGTGGGEKVLPAAAAVMLLVGIDQCAEMVEAANRNAAEAGISNARFFRMEAERLEFPDAFFNVISCRQSEFFADEAARVLAPGGIFFTQQVSEHDKLNVKQAFGRELDAAPGTLGKRYVTELQDAGFRDIETFEFHVDEYYKTPADLIFLLKHTPTIPDFGKSDRDFHILEQFIRDNRTDKGIHTTMERFIIIARK